jgi:hypothetical protein
MRQLATSTLTDQDISNPLVCHTYVADAARSIFIRLFVDQVQGDGTYLAYLTIQRGGSGPEFLVVPTTDLAVGGGQTALSLTTIAIPVFSGDVVRVYFKGRSGDTATPDVTTEVWEDDSSLYNAVPGGYPTGTAGYALGRIVAAGTVRVEVPFMSTSKIEIVKGDDYDAEHGTGILFSHDQWPDLTNAAVDFVVADQSIPAVVQSAQQVLVELTAAQTEQMHSGYFTLLATFPDGDEYSLIPKAKLTVVSRVA